MASPVGIVPTTSSTTASNKKNETKEKKKKELKGYTKSEVAKHHTRDDVWIIVKGQVYDVTSYVDDHMGGDAILNHAGGDNTEAFYSDQHPQPKAEDVLNEFHIGHIIQ